MDATLAKGTNPQERTVAVFGSTGFNGAAVVRRLQAGGWTVRGISRRGGGGDESVRLDAMTAGPAEIAAAIQGCAAVVNLVGIKTGDVARFERMHVGFVRDLVAAMLRQGVGRLVHVSACVTDPTLHRYHRTKLESDELVRTSGLAWTLVRPSVVWGPGDDFVRNLGALVASSSIIPVPAGSAPVRPVNVDDVALLIAACVEGKMLSEAIDVVGPEEKPLGHWVRLVAEARGLPVMVVPLPGGLFRFGARVIETMSRGDPLVTLGQSQLLSRGFSSQDDGLARLGISSRPLTVEAAVGLLADGGAKKAPFRLRWRKPVV